VVTQGKILVTIIYLIIPHHIMTPKMCIILSIYITLHTIICHLLNQITFWGGNSTCSSIPIRSMAGLGNSGMDIDPNTDEGM